MTAAAESLERAVAMAAAKARSLVWEIPQRTWGRPTDYDGDGRPNVFVREMDGVLVVTHVTWAIGEGPQGGDHHHDGEHH